MKWLKENAVPFLMTAAACAVGFAIILPLINTAMEKLMPTKK